MKFEFKRWWSGEVIFSIEAGSQKATLEQAVRERADLGDADLGDADLGDADLGDAKNAETARLDTGETLREYIDQVVPALITAGGKTIEEVAAAWDCHSWENCPMAAAFSCRGIEGVPALYRPRAEQFVLLFDAGLIPRPCFAVGTFIAAILAWRRKP